MKNLPILLKRFVVWSIIKAPRRIFRFLKTVLALLNNEFSFTLNLRLMFTPLFGDYTIPGRIIGFIFRLTEIVFGSLILLALGILTLLSPLIWGIFPLFLGLYDIRLLIIFNILLFLAWLYANKDTPEKRVSELKDQCLEKTFRPNALKLVDQLTAATSKGIANFQTIKELSFVLKKSELNKDFINTLQSTPINAKQIVQSAFDYAKKQNTRYVEIEQVFLAVIANASQAENLLATFGTNSKMLEATVKWILDKKEDLAKVYIWQEDYKTPTIGGIGKGMTGRVTPALNTVSEDFTIQVKKGLVKKIIGREKEIKEIADLLSSSKVNVLIIGEPGSGKTSIVKGIAFKIMQGTEYKALKFKRIVSLNMGGLIAGTTTPGQIAAKLTTIMKEIEESGDIILFIDEIHTLVADTGEKEGAVSSMFSILEPYLSSGRIQFMGATNIANYRKYLEPNGSFARLFQIIEIPQASKEDSLEILKYVAYDFEKTYNVIISYQSLEKTVSLSEKLIHERVLPDKAIDILSRTVSTAAQGNKYVTQEDIAKEISEVTHVPVSAITQEESQKLLNIETDMKKQVIGQDGALNQIGSALKRARVGMRNENKPIASFLFVGTTGVGKTETAKALAKTYFGDSKAMIRLDMSEYQQTESITKLIGSNSGEYKGILTEAVRTRPFALILLDEIEKAASNVLLVFLQILDDGRATDSSGMVIDFTNTIIIATSNTGTRAIQEIAQRNGVFEEIQNAAMKEVREHFAPEFLNRFNGIIVFNPLDLAAVGKIAQLLLTSVIKLAEEKGVKLSFKQELIDELIKRGFSPEWGARPLARVIENSVESYIAVKFLSKELKQGDILNLGLEVFEQK